MSRTRFEMTARGHVLHGNFVSDRGPNTFTEALLDDIDRFSERVERDPEIRAAIVGGQGKVFCLGTDLSQLEEGFGDPHRFRHYLDRFNATMNRLEALPVPVVAAVNGLVRAGGLEIVLACDLAVIADDALIGDAHSAQYAIPAGGSTQRLPRRVGLPRAKELIWSGRFMSAAEAVEWGLCYAAVPADRVVATAEELVATFVDKPRPCLSEIKSLIAHSETMSVADGVQLEILSFLQYVQNFPFVRNAFEAFKNRKAKAVSA